MKFLFAFVLFIHGVIHLMGFIKAFHHNVIPHITKEVSKTYCILWMVVAFLFIISAIMFFNRSETWPIMVIVSVIISQMLIILIWEDAKFGTIVNSVILVIAILSWGNQHFDSQFEEDVRKNIERTNAQSMNLLRETDIQFLPVPVQKYLRYTGALDKPKVRNMRITFDGEMRGRRKDWFSFRSVQYNFFDQPSRLFFMKAKINGITVPGYHSYDNANATMDIRLFGLVSIVKEKGPIMNKAETVTVFNDMCIMAPAALIDKRIQWEAIDDSSVKATFINDSIEISAILHFNEFGQLVNFISNDRHSVDDMKAYPFSTPMMDYKEFDGRNIPSYGEAVWHYPDGEFIYGKFSLLEIEYNISDFEHYNF